MAIKDMKTNLVVDYQESAISTNTTTNFGSIDTADYENGFTFNPIVVNFTDGTYVFTLEESDDDSVFTAVDITCLILDSGNSTGTITITANSSAGSQETIGAFGTKRYLRVSAVSTGVTSGANTQVLTILGPEVVPQEVNPA